MALNGAYNTLVQMQQATAELSEEEDDEDEGSPAAGDAQAPFESAHSNGSMAAEVRGVVVGGCCFLGGGALQPVAIAGPGCTADRFVRALIPLPWCLPWCMHSSGCRAGWSPQGLTGCARQGILRLWHHGQNPEDRWVGDDGMAPLSVALCRASRTLCPALWGRLGQLQVRSVVTPHVM